MTETVSLILKRRKNSEVNVVRSLGCYVNQYLHVFLKCILVTANISFIIFFSSLLCFSCTRNILFITSPRLSCHFIILYCYLDYMICHLSDQMIFSLYVRLSFYCFVCVYLVTLMRQF